VRVADRDDELSHPQRLGVAELGRLQSVSIGPQHREVRQGVGPDNLERELAAVDERRTPAAGAGDDVGGRQHEAVRRDHDGAAAAPPDAQVRHGRRELLGNADDGLGIRVERVLLRRRRDVRELHSSQASNAHRGYAICESPRDGRGRDEP
jgi:hypothetical protein